MVKLENQVEDCTNPERIRLLDGPEESVDELMQKLEKVYFNYHFYSIHLNSG